MVFCISPKNKKDKTKVKVSPEKKLTKKVLYVLEKIVTNKKVTEYTRIQAAKQILEYIDKQQNIRIKRKQQKIEERLALEKCIKTSDDQVVRIDFGESEWSEQPEEINSINSQDGPESTEIEKTCSDTDEENKCPES